MNETKSTETSPKVAAKTGSSKQGLKQAATVAGSALAGGGAAYAAEHINLESATNEAPIDPTPAPVPSEAEDPIVNPEEVMIEEPTGPEITPEPIAQPVSEPVPIVEPEPIVEPGRLALSVEDEPAPIDADALADSLIGDATSLPDDTQLAYVDPLISSQDDQLLASDTTEGFNPLDDILA